MDYESGALLRAVATPQRGSTEAETWLDLGDWLALANRVGAERVFFVENDPVFVFHDLLEESEQAVLEAYRRAWCMARPHSLFLALPGELRVYSLDRPPARNLDEWRDHRPVEIIRTAAEVEERLHAYRRELVESGEFFAREDLASSGQRADKRLIQDLKAVRRSLLREGLEPPYAHALIGRAIFVRYLEDRGILTAEYFYSIGRQRSAWLEALQTEDERPHVIQSAGQRHFYRVLRDRDFTFALFDRLTEDFNGDMFPRDPAERDAISAEHLRLLRGFLLGDTDQTQPDLFFWAYDFEIVPIELISSIYEEFYHQAQTKPSEEDHSSEEDEVEENGSGGDESLDGGTHYTPSFLVEDILYRVLTTERLKLFPRVLDPACGSGIFLVEAYRRLVRYHIQQNDGRITRDDLRRILKEQIVGIEINQEAVRISAFSLYLALLNYQLPPDILKNGPLPKLIHVHGSEADADNFGILFNVDTFSLTRSERAALEKRLVERRRFKGRTDIEKLLAHEDGLEGLGTPDVIIGNPPWQEARADSTARLWARAFDLPIGDHSYSQLFLCRSLSLVSERGVVGLLVHSSVLFNQRETSRDFRRHWLATVEIKEVINFVHVRHLIFDRAIAPFVFIAFGRRDDKSSSESFPYISARRTRAAEQLNAVVLSNADRRVVRQAEMHERDYLWKTYWWGGHRDAAFLSRLELEPTLESLLKESDPKPAYGFQRGSDTPSHALQQLKPLRSRPLRWYGTLHNTWFETAPNGVKRQPDERIYEGQRLIAVRGIKKGRPCIRLETAPFSFRHTIYCVPLPDLPRWQAEVLIGTVWSSLGIYRTFLTSGSWGPWYDSLVPDDVLHTPVRFADPDSHSVRRIIKAVQAIRSWSPEENRRGDTDEPPVELLETLDKAVFDLFQMTEAERDLVRDFIDNQFDLFRNGPRSSALSPVEEWPQNTIGAIDDLLAPVEPESSFGRYLRTFLEVWNPELDPDGEFFWRYLHSDESPVVAVVFGTMERGAREYLPSSDEPRDLDLLLRRLGDSLRQPLSRRVYIDGIIRVVTETEIVIVKRNEQRLWTPTAAREDAEATLLQAIRLQEAGVEG
jgi:SAM-dependent methyltransferase